MNGLHYPYAIGSIMYLMFCKMPNVANALSVTNTFWLIQDKQWNAKNCKL